MKSKLVVLAVAFMSMSFFACNEAPKQEVVVEQKGSIELLADEFANVELKMDTALLSASEKEMLGYLFDAGAIMDELFWSQKIANHKAIMDTITIPGAKKFFEINYGPWEVLNNNVPFLNGFGERPKGLYFYPQDMTVAEFEAWKNPLKTSDYTVIRRNADGQLIAVPYSEEYKDGLTRASELILKAAALAEDAGFKKYLTLRAAALLSNDYLASDLAWMDMKTNKFDFVVGPIENYQDELFGYKTAFESFILIKDIEESKKIEAIAKLLPELQKRLPVDAQYKAEVPGSSSDLGVYNAVYYAGDCNSGSKTIAINLPNDPRVHNTKGSRKLQLKNAMQYKFDLIMMPISKLVINPEQLKHVKFDAFFENVMFHEIAHGMGIKYTLKDKKITVRDAIQNHYAGVEEAKADIMGLYLVSQMHEMGKITDKDLQDNYITFIAGIFRSVRFGAASAHGKANMATFNYMWDNEAVTRNAEGVYTVNFEKMKEAVKSLTAKILVLQGDGNIAEAEKMMTVDGNIRPELASDLDSLAKAGIPRDLYFIQGKAVNGLK